VALVTGGTQGIGRATVAALSRAGFRVAVLARTDADVQATVGEIRALGSVALPIVADVTQLSEVEQALRAVVEAFSALDVLVNNAGTGVRKPFDQMTAAECDSLIDLNLRGLIHCTRLALQHMKRQGRGCIVNIASRAGRLPEPEMAVYSATKAAVLALTRSLAEELEGTRVRVVAISPGPVDTERIRRLRPDVDRTGWLTPDDVAQAVVFLASSQADRYNGATLDLFR
jgi:3-oxoacyl-[acyl-carrier protein] reductase